MLRAENLHKSFGDLPILKGIDLHVKKSEVISIVGSSGAGKTTLLQILGTLDKPDQGLLQIDGINPFDLSQKKISEFRNKNIVVLFLFPLHVLFFEMHVNHGVLL